MKKGSIVTVKIDDYAFGGKGVVKTTQNEQPYVLFVNNALPGQTVKALIKKKRKKYAECNLIEVVENSTIEQDNEFQQISGAPFIKVPIEKQEELKKRTTLDVYRRLGGFQNIEELFDTFISAPQPFHYRNKMEYSFSAIGHDIYKDEEFDGFALGFKRRGTWWKVENLDKDSGLFDKNWEDQLHIIRKYCEETGLPAWHPPKKEGFFRHIVVRKSFAENKILVNLVTSSQGIKKFDPQGFLKILKEVLGERLAGFTHVVNDDVADRAKIENGSSQCYYGAEKITETLLGLKFEISMESFFQTNPLSAAILYKKAIDYATEEKKLDGQVIMDLFCGTGTIGQIVASQTKNTEIIGVDIVKEAIENAQRNAALNNITDIKFFAADVGKFLKEYPDYNGKIDTIILDPPRAGIAPKTLQKVIALGAQRIVYISCNPSTQARDAETLEDNGYKMKKVSLVDQFPHTAHIEAVAQFDLMS